MSGKTATLLNSHARRGATRPTPVEISTEGKAWVMGLGVGGALILAVGIGIAPVRALSAYLVAAMFYLMIATGALAWIAMLHVSNAGWGVVVKRLFEGLSAYIPVAAASMGVVLLGVKTLYPWAGEHAHDGSLHGKAAYLNVPAFAVRMAIVLALWIGFSTWLRRASVAQDEDGSVRHTRRSVVLSAVFIPVFAISFSVASFDWLMSLSPHWQSTVFAFYHIAGSLVAALAAAILGASWLRRRGHLPEVTENHFHDLAKLLIGMVTFWAYLWFCQYMLIWYANMPEETAYYITRLEGGYKLLFWLNPILGWVVPFLALLPRPLKRSERHLVRVALLVLFSRWLDLYMAVAPSTSAEHTGIGLIEAGAMFAVGALFVLSVLRALKAAPLVASKDPYWVESLHHHQ